MKYRLKILLGMVLAVGAQLTAHTQDRPANLRAAADIFKNFSGYLDEDKKYHLEGEGYNIVITEHDRIPNAGNFKNIAENIPGKAKVLQDKMNNVPAENYVLDLSLNRNKPPIAARDYIIAGKNHNILDISIARYNGINPAFTDEIVSSIFYDSIYAPMLVDTKNNIIDFAGRRVKCDGDCYWLKPHMIKCTSTGIITWYLFNSLAEAEAYKQTEQWIARKEIGKKMHDTARVPIYFEGVATTADQYRFESSEFNIGFYSDNQLVNAYYITAAVRGRFVYCRLIFSDLTTRKVDPESGLPLMIAKFMRFK